MAEIARDPPPFFTGRIAGWSRRHRRLVLVAWLFIAVFTVGACFSLASDDELDSEGTGESADVFNLREERFGEAGDSVSETIVFEHPTLTVDDREYRATVEGLLGELRALRALNTESVTGTEVASSTRVFAATESHYDIGEPRDQSPLVSAGSGDGGGDVTFASAVYATAEFDDVDEELDTIRDLVEEHASRSNGFQILIGGGFLLIDDDEKLSDEDFSFASLVNLPLTIIIMVLALGAIVAAGVPIALAYLGVAMAAGVVTIISQFTPMLSVWLQVVLLMGLAAGIDYALFLFTRFRYERGRGRDEAVAAAIAGTTAGKGVLIAGTTTMLAILGMFLVGDPVFTSLTIAAVVAIAVALVVAQTLMPAILGDGLSKWSIPGLRRHNVAQTGVLNAAAGFLVKRSCTGRGWWISGALGIAVLLVFAYPILNFNLGFNGVTSFSDDLESKAAIEALEEDFTIGILAPAEVIVDPGRGKNIFAADVQAGVTALTDAVGREIDRAEAAGEHVPFAQPIGTEINRAGDTEIIEIPINADTGDQEAIDAVNLLRDELVPAAFGDSDVAALTGGVTAGQIDFRDNINAKTPLVIAFVIITAYIILVVMYRSLILPAIAVVLNLLAVGAAYGILVQVFQEGWLLEGILDFEATGIIESWLPLLVFAITFGISMDYLTFAMGRVQELYRRGYSTEDAILMGVRDGFGIVFSAAAIMVAVATVFAFTRSIALQQFGFALALTVLLDATIILIVVLPAMMRLAHDRLWYLPWWLEWLPGGPKDSPERDREERELESEPGPAPTPAGG